MKQKGATALRDLYQRFGTAQTVEQKINILTKEIGCQVFVHGTPEIKLACMEVEWLTLTGVTELEFFSSGTPCLAS